MPRLLLPRSLYDFLVCDFPYNFSDIVGDHAMACVVTCTIHTGIVRFLALAFVDILRQSRTEITVIVGSLQILSVDRTEPWRCPYGVPWTSE